MKHDFKRVILIAFLFTVFSMLIVFGCAKTVPQDAFMVVPATAAKFNSKSYLIENRSNTKVNAFVKVILPFAKGEYYDQGWQEAETKTPVILTPIKWHIEGGRKGSVALAQALFPLTLPPQSKVIGKLFTGEPVKDPPPFFFGQNLLNLAGAGLLQQSFIAGLKVNGVYCTATLQGAAVALNANQYSATFRFRDYFNCQGTILRHASATFYVTAYSGKDYGEITVVLGNDNVEAVHGDFVFEDYSLFSLNPFDIEVLNRPAFGASLPTNLFGYKRNQLVGPGNLADGQTIAHRVKFIVRGNAEDEANFAASLSQPIGEWLGVAGPDHWRNSEALGATGFIPSPRFPTVTSGYNALTHHCTDTVNAGPFDHIGMVNKNPPSTGDQPDFMAGSPIFAQQAVQTQNACGLRRALPSVYREALRPQQYWYQADPAKQETWPDLFFWSSRIHYDWNWNTGKGANIWQSRTQPFQAGDSRGWGSMDEEHYGHNHLRAYYELTADPFIGDKLLYYNTMGAWNFYTGQTSGRGRFHAMGAERAFGRSGKEALAIAQFFPDSFAGNFLITKDAEKVNTTAVNAINANVTNYGFAMVQAQQDARIGPSLACMQGAFEPQLPRTGDCSCPMAWQTGFTLEKLYQNITKGVAKANAEALMDKYLDAAPLYFDTAGVPYTYFLSKAPTLPAGRAQGGIGIQWWAGWLLAAKARPNHPQAAFINGAVKSQVSQSWTQGSIEDQYWYTNQKWQTVQ